MSNKKPIPQLPTVPVEEEIEEDLKTIDETETPLLSGKICTIFRYYVLLMESYNI